MTAIQKITDLVIDAPQAHPTANLQIAHNALIDTVSCILAGSRSTIANNAFDAVAPWGAGSSVVIGSAQTLSPPLAALVNAAAGHAHDYDDYDAAANSHPSVVLFPALLALGQEHRVSLDRVLDAYIIGLEILQRLGEAFGPGHYKRGWLATMTLGIFAVAGACCRLMRASRETTISALSLSVSMSSGLTNQIGHTAKQLHPGITAKNGMMAFAFASGGITGSDAAIDGPVGFARLTSSFDAERFDGALAKLGNPWSIEEHGVITKVSPLCGYTQRIVEAASALHSRLGDRLINAQSIRISIPDYYSDILIHSKPSTDAEAMFSAEYSVAVALLRGGCDFSALSVASLSDPDIVRLRDLGWVDHRTPRDPDIYYDPLDPDVVEVTMDDGKVFTESCSIPVGASTNPLGPDDMKRKFDDCFSLGARELDKDGIWSYLSACDGTASVDELLGKLGGPAISTWAVRRGDSAQ